MKVVYNACHGGFGLSEKACRLLAERKEFDLTGYHHESSVMCNQDVVGYYPKNIERHDADLVHVVELLGDAASGEYARVRIKEIPDGVEYEISEYDGHEYWCSY